MDDASPISGTNETNCELAPFLAISETAQRFTEAGRSYIFLEKLRFTVGGVQRVMDALLCLNWPNASYPTKLFFPESLGHGLNWNENAFILGRNWATWSWKDVSPNHAPFAILAEHLRAFR
jgi:hypothetical protein